MQQNQTDALGKEKVSKLLFKLSVPAIVAQIINLLYNLVDRMYIGHIEGVGKLALTGVGVCFPLIMIITAFSSFVSMGAAPRASIYLGMNDKEKAEQTLGNSVTLLIIMSVVLTILFQVFSKDFLLMFGASENTLQYGLDYILIYTLGTTFVLFTLGLNAFITCQGDSKTSMITVVIGAVLNIILDPVFIFAFDMGVKGAAIATIISQCVSMIFVLKYLNGKKTTIRIRKKYLKLSPKIFLPCLALGISPFIMQSTESLIAVCFNSSLFKYGGDLAVGAMAILTSVMQFAMLPLLGLSQGAQPIMSYNLGAKKPNRMKEVFKFLLISSLVYTVLLWTSIQLFPELFVLIFNNDPELVEFTSRALRIYMGMSWVFGIQISCQQSFIALGNAKSSLIAALLRKIVILIPLIYIMPMLPFFGDKTTAVFVAEPVADFLAVIFTASLFTVQFKRVLKKLRLEISES